jgi:hypothetical protein
MNNRIAVVGWWVLGSFYTKEPYLPTTGPGTMLTLSVLILICMPWYSKAALIKQYAADQVNHF